MPFPNFIANIGSSQTSSAERRTASRGRPQAVAQKRAGAVPGSAKAKPHSAPQSIAAAGVGSPMKLVCWRSSTLNFASLRAEKTASTRGI